jgi:hypothetical protein
LWVWAAKVEPGDRGADNCTVLWYFARMAQLPMLMEQPAKSTIEHSKQTSDAFVK